MQMALTGARDVRLGSRESAHPPQLVVETSAAGLGLPMPGLGTGSPGPPAGTGAQYPIRGMVGRDFSASGFDDIAELGFNLIDTGPNREDLDQLSARGLKAFIWLGGYENGSTCQFHEDDAWIRDRVGEIAGHPAIAGYFIDDEPNPTECPGVYSQIKQRSDLVKSLDPRPPTFVLIDSNSGQDTLDQLPRWVGATDIAVLDPYPCYVGEPCDYSWIDRVAEAADSAGLRYWGTVQAFGDSTWRVPTLEELHEEFVHWRGTRMDGYLVFAWHWPDGQESLWLANHPELQSQLAVENARQRDPVVAAAGDIAGSPTDSAGTAAVIERIAPDRVLPLGDNAYPDGSATDYRDNYDPNWGRFKQITSPTPGNHDYDTAGGSGYYGYFGARAPAPYYSYDLGGWHLVSVNGEVSLSSSSEQMQWLKDDLAAHPAKCTLAYWHEPHFSSGGEHGSSSYFEAVWRTLHEAGVDVVLNGHDHDYERFAPQEPTGTADPEGIREFVVGTGGASHYAFGSPIANSEVRDDTSFGVLQLTLHPAGYDWRFVPVAGATFTDAGDASCH
jgi:Calcineurin-like phosphoesterase